jgi:hypothetical protein
LNCCSALNAILVIQGLASLADIASNEPDRVSLEIPGPLTPFYLDLARPSSSQTLTYDPQVSVSAGDGPNPLTKYPTVRLDIGVLSG